MYFVVCVVLLASGCDCVPRTPLVKAAGLPGECSDDGQPIVGSSLLQYGSGPLSHAGSKAALQRLHLPNDVELQDAGTQQRVLAEMSIKAHAERTQQENDGGNGPPPVLIGAALAFAVGVVGIIMCIQHEEKILVEDVDHAIDCATIEAREVQSTMSPDWKAQDAFEHVDDHGTRFAMSGSIPVSNVVLESETAKRKTDESLKPNLDVNS